MNRKQLAILICALAVSGMVVWHDLPLEVPMVIIKALMLFLKLFAVMAVAAFAIIFAGGKKSVSRTDTPADRTHAADEGGRNDDQR